MFLFTYFCKWRAKKLNQKALIYFQNTKGWFSGSSVNYRPLSCLKQEWKLGAQPVLKSQGGYLEPSHRETLNSWGPSF